MDKSVIKQLIKNHLKNQCQEPSVVSLVSAASQMSNDEDMDKQERQEGNRVNSRELEEQLNNLKKENFQLKLRIYFLEERFGFNAFPDKESAEKKNLDLMVQVESLSAELQRKHELLTQAVLAMEVDEEEFKKQSEKKDEEIDILQKQLVELKDALQKSADYRYNTSVSNTELMKKLQGKCDGLEQALLEEKNRLADVTNKLELAQRNLVVNQSKIIHIEEESKEKDEKIAELKKEINSLTLKITSYRMRIRKLDEEASLHTVDMKKKEQELQNTLNESKQLRQKLAQYDSMLEAEQKKSEKLKALMVARDSKIMELDNLGKSLKTRTRKRDEPSSTPPAPTTPTTSASQNVAFTDTVLRTPTESEVLLTNKKSPNTSINKHISFSVEVPPVLARNRSEKITATKKRCTSVPPERSNIPVYTEKPPEKNVGSAPIDDKHRERSKHKTKIECKKSKSKTRDSTTHNRKEKEIADLKQKLRTLYGEVNGMKTHVKKIMHDKRRSHRSRERHKSRDVDSNICDVIERFKNFWSSSIA